MATENRRR